MANMTLTVARNDGSSTVVNPIVDKDNAGRVNTRKASFFVNGASVEATVQMPGYTPLPQNE